VRIEVKRAHAGDGSQSTMKSPADTAAALAVNQSYFGAIGQQRVVQDLVDARQRLLDGEAVQVHVTARATWRRLIPA